MAAKAVLDTAPIIAREDGLILFSMIGTRVLYPYLVAVKSLHARLGRGRVVVLDDGTLTREDKRTLAHHCGNPRIISIASVDTGPCPVGGTWERLLTILDLRRDDYVIQFDSDTVTLGPIPQVSEAITANRSFTIRGEDQAEILPAEKIARLHGGSETTHVQGAIEKRMGEIAIDGVTDLRYVRGCAGFTGFARNPDGRFLAERFSIAAEDMLGAAKWAEWGSEQVTSNFVIANADGALLLPYDRYVNYWNETMPADTRFAHFIGTYRFHNGEYLWATRDAIDALNSRTLNP